MAHYLLSVYQPQGAPPSDEELGAIMGNVEKLQDDMRTAGVWVFSGVSRPPTPRRSWPRAATTCWSPTARSSSSRSTSAV